MSWPAFLTFGKRVLKRSPVLDRELQRVAVELQRRQVRSVLVSGLTGGEGASTVAANLALAWTRASAGRALLVEGDLRAPSLHAYLGLKSDPGWSDWRGDAQPPWQATGISKNVSFLPAGKPSTQELSAESFSLARQIAEQSRTAFDFVVWDTSPGVKYPDGKVLSALVDGVVLVAVQDRTRMDQLSFAYEQYQRAGATVLGVILNRSGRYFPRLMRSRR